MKQDNVNPSLLEKNEQILENPSKNLITASMLQSIKLKKKNLDQNDKELVIKEKNDKQEKTDKRVPSLDEIQDALKRLKKTNSV